LQVGDSMGAGTYPGLLGRCVLDAMLEYEGWMLVCHQFFY
jgi:hypothetical protein